MKSHLPGNRQSKTSIKASGRSRGDKTRSSGRKLTISSLLLALPLIGLIAASIAIAYPALTATAPTNVSIDANATNALTGASLGGGDSVTTLRVSVATDKGTLSLANNPTGLTLAEGFSSWQNQAELAFTGTRDDINTALASLSINPGNNGGDNATVTINAQAFTSGMVYSPTNGHYYEYVSSPGITWTDARSAAAGREYGGQQGYLATIPSSAINDLIASKIPGADNVWFGAQGYNEIADPEAAVQRRWSWVDGPLAGTAILECSNYSSGCSQINGPWPLASIWASGEPNNASGETAPVTNWSGSVGRWNDLSPTNSGAVGGYLVEYGDQANGSSTAFSGTATAAASIPIGDVSTPPTGTSASMAPGSQSATVSWTAPDNGAAIPAVTGYTVMASPGGATCSGDENATSCTIDGLDWGVAYTFTVTAENSYGTSAASGASNSVTPLTAPSDVSDVEASFLATTATISWAAPTFTGGSALTLYTVTSYPEGLTCSATPPATTCDIAGLTLGTEYYFVVTATNSNTDPHEHTSPGETAATSPAITPVTAPGAPEEVTATTYHNTATVSWTAPTQTGGLPLVSYRVVAEPDGASCTAVAPLTTCTIGGLDYDTEYTFTVYASNDFGESDPSDPSAGVTPIILPPGAPVDVAATAASDTSAAVTWNPPAETGGGALTYTVTVEPGGLSCVTTSTSCVIEGLEPGRGYVFFVRASNSAGSADSSVARSEQLDMADPFIATVTLGRKVVRPRNARGKLITRMFKPRRGRNAKNRAGLKVRGGTKMVVTTNKGATLKTTIYARTKDARLSKRWVKVSAKLPKLRVKQGASDWRFSARAGVTPMKPGKYRMTFRLTAANGDTAIPAPIEFTVVPRNIR